MLESYFSSPRQLFQMRGKPLAEHMDGLAARLHRQGFTRATGRRILSLTGRLNEFARREGIEEAEGIGDELVERYIDEELFANGVFRDARSRLQHLLEHLRAEGVVSPVAEAGPEDPFAALVSSYARHLSAVRGLSSTSCSAYVRYARRLLCWYGERHRGRALSRLAGVDVVDYITELADLHPSGSWRNNLCSLTRVFLRYLRWEGILDADLDRVVPTVPHWRLQSIPRHLPWEQVQALIKSVDTSTAMGMRDKAVLLCIASLGLRNQEIRTLQLGDLGWQEGKIRLRKTKSRRERVLPLFSEVGKTLAEYVQHGRPRLEVPQVFLTHRAPRGPIESTGGIGGIVRKHLLRAGIDAPSYGAHVLRHSLATRMVNQGVPIKQIADLLGHRSIDTTAIYTKVDTRSLSAVALPFPGGEA